MESVLLDDWSLIWDRTNNWIQLKGINGEFEIESSPVEAALGPFVVQTGHSLYKLGVPSKNSCDWIVPKDIRDEFSKGFPKEWVVKITALQERRVTRHTPKREGPIREKSSTLSKSSRISEKMEDSLYRGMSDKQKERARKLDRLRALQQELDSFKASESPEVSSRSKKSDEKVKKPPKKAPKRVAARKNSAKIIVSKEKKKIEEKNSSENENEPQKPKKGGKKASTKKEKTDRKTQAPKRKRNQKETENCVDEKERSPAKKALVKNSKKTASKKAPQKKIAPKKTPKKSAKEAEAEILSPDRSSSKIPSAPENGLPTPTFKSEKKKAKNLTQKEKRAHLQRVDELNRVEKQVITPVRKPSSFKPACEAENDLFGSPKNKENENRDPFSTPAVNRRQNDGFATPAEGAFATPAASSSAGSPSACRFQTPGEMDFNTSKKFSKTPSGNISKKKLASRVKANDFIKKQMEEQNLETDLFDKNGRKKRSKLSKKERVEMSALLPVEENEKDEDETDEYF